jgi:hypothetical protein
MNWTSFSLSSASDHHQETFFFCGSVGPSLQTVPQRPKIKPIVGQNKLKTSLGFETLPQTRDLSQQWAKKKRVNYELKWAWAFEHLPQAWNLANNRPKKRRADYGPKRDFPLLFFPFFLFATSSS